MSPCEIPNSMNSIDDPEPSNSEAFIESELKKYNTTDAAIAKLSEQYMPLKVIDATDDDGYQMVKSAKRHVRTKRLDVEVTRKSLKKKSLEFGRSVDAEAKRIVGLLQPIEDYLTTQEKVITDEIAMRKAEKERIAQDEKDAADERFRLEEEARQDAIKAEQEAEDARLEAQRIKQEEEQEKIRLDQQAVRRAQEKVDIENKRIEDEEKERQNQAKIREAERVGAENAKIEATKQAEKKAEQDKLATEQAEKDEKLRLAMLPDREKLSVYADQLRALPLPSLSHASHVQLTCALKHVKAAYAVLKDEKI